MSRIIAAALTFALIVPAAHAGEVHSRLQNQQSRISQGMRSGQLTPGETIHLERREATINARRNADLAAHGGHLTPGDYRRLNARGDSVSGRSTWTSTIRNAAACHTTYVETGSVRFESIVQWAGCRSRTTLGAV